MASKADRGKIREFAEHLRNTSKLSREEMDWLASVLEYYAGGENGEFPKIKRGRPELPDAEQTSRFADMLSIESAKIKGVPYSKSQAALADKKKTSPDTVRKYRKKALDELIEDGGRLEDAIYLFDNFGSIVSATFEYLESLPTEKHEALTKKYRSRKKS